MLYCVGVLCDATVYSVPDFGLPSRESCCSASTDCLIIRRTRFWCRSSYGTWWNVCIDLRLLPAQDEGVGTGVDEMDVAKRMTWNSSCTPKSPSQLETTQRRCLFVKISSHSSSHNHPPLQFPTGVNTPLFPPIIMQTSTASQRPNRA